MRKEFSLLIIAFLFSPLVIILNSNNVLASDNSSLLLELKEGMKYHYIYYGPGGFNWQITLYITTIDETSWKGIGVSETTQQQQKYTYIYRFIVDKNGTHLYESDYLRLKNIVDENQQYKEIKGESSFGLTMILVVYMCEKLYDFNMEELIEKESLTTTWSGNYTANLSLQSDLTYQEYTAYKIIAAVEGDELLPTTATTYYVSPSYPYLLIHEDVYVSGYGNYVTIDLEGTEQKSFNASDYNIDEPPNKQPRGQFNYTIDKLSVEFDASASYDTDGTINSYVWDFGDGTNGTGITTTHTYTKNGNYTIKLYVYDDEGEQGYSRNTITVNSSSTDKRKTPGFELLIVFCALSLILFLKSRRIIKK
jgi:hypothetical protein